MNNNPVTANLLQTPAFVVANTFLGIAVSDKSLKYPITETRLQLLCFMANRKHKQNHMVNLFYEDFIITERNGRNIPVLASITCLYHNEINLVKNADNQTVTVIDVRDASSATYTIRNTWDNMKNLSDDDILDIIDKNVNLNIRKQGEILHI